MPAMSCSTSVLMPRRSIVGCRRALISAELRRLGASTCARPAIETCWNNMAAAPGREGNPRRLTVFRPPGQPGPGSRNVSGSVVERQGLDFALLQRARFGAAVDRLRGCRGRDDRAVAAEREE